MKFTKDHACLYAVTERAWKDVHTHTLYEKVEEALKGGITCLQLREKSLSDEEFLKEAFEICTLCREYGVPFIVNDRVDIALRVGADGVHVGGKDMPPSEVRKIAKGKLIVGVTAKTVERAIEAEQEGADYIGSGAVFPTSTKPDATPLDRRTLSRICESVNIPVVAIGGITSENISELGGLGLSGAAVASGVFGVENTTDECKKLILKAKEIIL